MTKSHTIDTTLAILLGVLILIGVVVFSSASMGLLSRDGANYSTVLVKQGILELVGLGLLFLISMRVPYRLWGRYSTHLFVLSLLATVLVFVPHIGVTLKGGTRWINLGFGTIQPAEFLKLGTVLFLAAYYTKIKASSVSTLLRGFLPFVGLLGVIALVMLKQPDTGTFLVIVCAATGVFIAAGGRWLHLGVLGLICLGGLFVLAETRPYVKDRIETYLHPKQDMLGTSYQLHQSLIAVGSGQLMGRGFGQSVQKFNYLPEPIGDSIFSVLSEDFGFIGSSLLVLLLSFFALRGLRVSDRVPDSFGRLVGVGIVILIVSQSFINIGALTGVIPLTGVPLVFVSPGGTALVMAFIEAGILLSISKYTQRT